MIYLKDAVNLKGLGSGEADRIEQRMYILAGAKPERPSFAVDAQTLYKGAVDLYTSLHKKSPVKK